MGKSKLRDEKFIKKNKKEFRIKIALGCLAFIVLLLAAYYGVYYFILEESNYFLDHFASMILMILIGIIAILMPLLNGQKLVGENKGDNLMLVVGILLIVCGLISVLMSYIKL
jgi:amino acid permease